ncbi:DNA oxidative demethylase AlkB [Terriglobus sp. 2YAB30_2]|uniref:DNA oxidative demethylase AlkB n=1 Tax=unclassified Terriglobus TaxID=2628988 RepID=UPI003F9B1F87
MTQRLFQTQAPSPLPKDLLGPGTAVLAGFALAVEHDLLSALKRVTEQSPFRNMVTPSGFRMSVAMSNCGELGWVTDRTGYRYDHIDPQTNEPWPEMPAAFKELATGAAKQAGFLGFAPDACLINRYEPGSKLSLHQDKDERDYTQPIVSVSLGLPATFLFGGLKRTDPIQRIQVIHGDVLVWGGPARLRYHGIAPLRDGMHSQLGAVRYNLTFRKAG